MSPVSLSQALARIGAVAELLSIAAGELFALAAMCGGGLERRSEISIDGAFARLGLRSGLPPEPERSQLVAELRRRDRMFGDRLATWLGRGDESLLELTQGDGNLTLGLVTLGDAPLADDLARLREVSHAGFAVERLADLLGDREVCAGVVDHFRPPAHHNWELLLDLRAGAGVGELLALAEGLEIRQAQRDLLADTHPILAGDRSARFALCIGPGVVYPTLRVAYLDLAPEALIRLLAGLDINADPGEALGSFLGALGSADRVPVVELTLGQHPPPSIRLGV